MSESLEEFEENENSDKGGPVPGSGSIDVTPDGAQLNNIVVTSPILTDWGPVFELFNLDASEFEVVDDTVRMSTWQQSRRTSDGHRDTIQLYSYKARFRRVNRDLVPEVKVAAWRKALMASPRPRSLKSLPRDADTTYVILIADPQLGKKGTDEAVENWKRGVLGHIEAIRTLRAQGHGPGAVHVAFQGDETENVVNSYGNQPHTIELNRSQQLELDFDMRVWTLKEVAALGLSMTASSVISNHGEWTRNGGKEPVTTQSDNASTHIARQVAKLFKELEALGGPEIDWYIGQGAPGVTVTLSSVPCYFSHGYIEKGRGGSTEIKTKSAIERQILGSTDRLGNVVLWFMAHYHHFYAQEFEGRTMFACPALEAERSSEYMLDQYGVWSPPGTMGLLVGDHTARGWSNLAVF